MYENLIIDGPYLAHRSYHAPVTLTTKSGIDSTMIHITLKTILALYKKFQPKKTTICWESPRTKSWRRDLSPTYKPSKPINTHYIHQLTALQQILHQFNTSQLYSPHNEADDVISYCTTRFKQPIVIFTTDKDIYQLIDTNIHIWDGKKIITPFHVKEKFGVSPAQIPDFLAIKGDSADNIQGIEGYGDKKTSLLINQYKHLESIPLNHPILREKTSNQPKILFNKQLTLLNCNCNVLPTCDGNIKPLREIIKKYELYYILDNLDSYYKLGC